jgi:colicin import membrane protein
MMAVLLSSKLRLQPPEYPFHIGYRYVGVAQADGTIRTEEHPLTEEDFLHPREEDHFMLTDAHSNAVAYLRTALRAHLAGHLGMKVFSEHRVDWQKDGIGAHGPDLVVFRDFNVPWNDLHGTVYVCDVGASPVLVAEVTSASTRHIDLEDKLAEYHAVGIPYYLILDLVEDHDGLLDPALALYRNTPEGYVKARGSSQGMFRVPELEIAFRVAENALEILDGTGRKLPDYSEAVQSLAETKALAETEAKRAETEAKRAEAEAKRADALAAELAALKARINSPSINGH